ncbi:universal stress protein [Paraburkholderia rhizosphaerae]|uniref:Nucleotide-binding universal stress UspA family protein n=1 Tax=Paraburkholderia rhizosphaerae TaxID=480658 RepID=A0A4R8LW55_9BURK|nr:universal stress protein [Paraburkholderia rhizosphaerae]TDY50926.1 nucleotide-binding universal stress UspA family protein [Paraburkholderia rhizosphaerae]
MYEKILVAVDGSETSKQALNEAVRMAALSHGKLHAAYVVDQAALFPYAGYYDPVAMIDAFRRDGRAALDDAATRFAAAGVTGETELIETDSVGEDVAHCLLKCAKRIGAELAVMGTHGRRGVRRAILGSVAERFVRLSECPVLLVRMDDAHTSAAAQT